MLLAQGPEPAGTPGVEKTLEQPLAIPVKVDFASLKVRFRPSLSAYPALARIGNVQGTVVVRLTIDPRGRVEVAEPIEGPWLLRPAAQACLRQWTFDPVVIQEKPSWVQCEVGVPFRRQDVPVNEGIPERHQVVLDIEAAKSAFSVRFDASAIRAEAQAALASLGLRLVEPSEATPESAYYLKLQIQTVQTPDGLYLHHVHERCSLYSDRGLQANDPAGPMRICVFNHVLGQKGEAGFQDSLIKTVRRTLQELGVPTIIPRALAVVVDKVNRSGNAGADTPMQLPDLAKIVDFDFSQIKVKRQPPAPPYPAYAKERAIQGTVVITLTIDPSGSPITAEALAGPSELLITAIRFGLQWEFEPARLNGIPQWARFELTMPFKLREDPFPSRMDPRRPGL